MSAPEAKTHKIECSHCGQRISVEASDLGTVGYCPSCNSALPVLVPAPPSVTQQPDSRYWLHIGGVQKGPYTESEVREFWQNGIVNAETLSWKEALTDWTPLGKVLIVLRPGAARSPRQQAAHQKPPHVESSPIPEGTDAGTALTERNLVPLGVCMLGLGWLSVITLPPRLLPPNSNSIIPVALLALPAVYFSIMAALFFLRPGKTPLRTGVGSLLFTMIAGLILLQLFFLLRDWVGSHGKHFYRGPLAIIKIIALAYSEKDSSNLFASFFGFIFGVGLCEEVTKLLPLFFILHSQEKSRSLERISYRSFLFIGFLSGIGFGIGEALLQYSPWGVDSLTNSNVLRWFSCVPLHAVWATTAAACLWRFAPTLWQEAKRKDNGWSLFGLYAASIALSAVLHGIYDVFCHRSIVLAIAMVAGSLILMVSLARHVDAWTRVQPDMKVADTTVSKDDWIACHASIYQANRGLFGVVFAVCIALILFVQHLGLAQTPASPFGLEMNEEVCVSYTLYYQLGQSLNQGLTDDDYDSMWDNMIQTSEEFRALSPAKRHWIFGAIRDGNQGRPDIVTEWRLHNR